METTKRGRKAALLSSFSFVVLLTVLVFVNRAELRTWYVLWCEFESLGKNAQGRPEYRHRQTGIVFVRLPGGTFDMGSPDGESGWGPVHEVKLGPFLIAKYEVSQAQWKKVMGGAHWPFDGGDLPARSISWSDCQTFCEVTALTIPTEAQWEYACRAGTTADFAFGESITNNQVNYAASYDTPKGQDRGTAVPVDSFKPNGFGLYNMHGNVSEWCHDTYDAEFYSKPQAVLRDPLSTSGSKEKVARGGSWGDSSKICRSAFRLGVDPSGRYDRFGFRPTWSSP